MVTRFLSGLLLGAIVCGILYPKVNGQGTPGVCDGVQNVLDNEGTIESPGFSQSQNYPKDVTCKWVIIGPAGSTVTMEFESFHLEESKVCNIYDYVTLKQRCTGGTMSGNLGDRSEGYCGTFKPPTINTTCNELHVTFHSDDSDTERGFRAIFKINKDSASSAISSSPIAPSSASSAISSSPIARSSASSAISSSPIARSSGDAQSKADFSVIGLLLASNVLLLYLLEPPYTS